MTLQTLIISGLVFAALAALVWSLKLATNKNISREEAEQRMSAFNIDALAKLMNRDEQEFLRSRLPTRTFRKIQRKRMRVVLAYLSDLSTILSTFDPSPLGDLRLLILRTRFQALRMWAFPSSSVAPCELVHAFQRISKSLV